jgi:hypothetical protein
MPKKTKMSRQQQRSLRTQQVILGIIGVIVILSMVISLIAR